MSLSVVYSRALNGLFAPLVSVEAHLANGLPAFNIVGLPEMEVKESRDRVRAAITTSGFEFPTRKITVNLAPADLPKESGRFDLPIAIGILAASGQIPMDSLERYEFAGELALSGELRPVRGALAMVWQAQQAGRAFILPQISAESAAWVKSAKIYPASSLAEVCAHLSGLSLMERQSPLENDLGHFKYPDLSDVKGQGSARWALELAAAGAHSLLMVGPPGTGKSMLAARLPGLLLPLEEQEALESAAIRSLGYIGNDVTLARPFRSPHHSASAVALVGGGSDPRPGEISLAHNGVLFLDELPEFDRKVLEVLREPLENGEIHISRANRQATFPARFQLVAAMNPCPCGYLGHPSGKCCCSKEQIQRYRGRISGPLLDRIDLVVEVPSLPMTELQSIVGGEDSATVRARVLFARQQQLQRQGKPNAQLTSTELDTVAMVNQAARQTLAQVAERLGLSARGYHRMLRVARTIADLTGDAQVDKQHVMQSVPLRRALHST